MVLATVYDEYGEFVRYLVVSIESSEKLYDVLVDKSAEVSTKEYLEGKGYECIELVGSVEVTPGSVDIDMPTES